MTLHKTDIEGVYLLEPKVFPDSRGCFFESFSERDLSWLLMEAAGDSGTSSGFGTPSGPGASLGRLRFVQDNESVSCRGVVRGLHFQKPPYAQSKLVRVVSGCVLDVAVDIRKGSPTYGKHIAVELSGDNKRQLFIPRGFAHGYSVLSDTAIFQYKCDNYYAPECEGGLLWNDADLQIDWKLPDAEVILSAKDASRRAFRDFDSPFEFGEDLYSLD